MSKTRSEGHGEDNPRRGDVFKKEECNQIQRTLNTDVKCASAFV